MAQIDQSALQARNRLLALFSVLCALDILLTAVARDRWAIGRIALTVMVMFFVLQGRKWAKWTLVVICSLDIAALLFLVMRLHAKLSLLITVGSLVMVVLSVFMVLELIRSKALHRYFYLKR